MSVTDGALTLRSVLALPALKRAGLEVLTAAGELDRGVRWLHASDLPDVGPLLREGDLVLTTGAGLPDAGDDAGFRTYAGTLSEAGAAGVIVELGRRWKGELPEAMVHAFASVELPLISLAHEVRFAAITQAVGELIVDRQLAELRDAQEVHDVFTELSFTRAGPEEVLEAVQRLAGAAVVVESDQHQVLDYRPGPGDVTDFLSDWAARSARVRIDGRTGWEARNGWLVTGLGPKERRAGRLVIESVAPPSARLIAVAERAAAALALHRLHHRDRDNLIRRTHAELLTALAEGPVTEDLTRRCSVAGFPLARRRFVGLTLRPVMRADGGRRPRSATEDLVALVVRACDRTPALIAEIDGDVRVLLSLPERARATAVVDGIGAEVLAGERVRIGAGRDADDASAIGRTLAESAQVADAIGPAAAAVVHRLEDVHIRGLLALMRDDERLSLFVDRELSPLREAGVLDAVRALLFHPTSKTDAAASLHLSRPAFYARLDKAEQVLGISLDDPDLRLSLHLALVAAELANASPAPGRRG